MCRGVNRVLQTLCVTHVNADQLGDHLAVGLGAEVHVVLACQPFLKFHKVFDNAVMHDRHGAALVRVRMRVDIGGRAMRCPTGMSDAGIAFEADASAALVVQKLLQIPDFSYFFADFDAAVAHQRDARGVIASVFQSLQTIQNHVLRVAFTHISYNSTHNIYSFCSRAAVSAAAFRAAGAV